MDEQERLKNKIEFKKASGFNIEKETQEALKLCLEQCKDIPVAPEIYLPPECKNADPLIRIKAKISYVNEQFQKYCNMQLEEKIGQIEYISSIVLGMREDIEEYYFGLKAGRVVGLEDPRYKVDLFIRYGEDEKAFTRGMKELLCDIKISFDQSPEEIYIAYSNLGGFMMLAYAELHSKMRLEIEKRAEE